MEEVALRLAVVAAIVAAAGAIGWWWRRRDGRLIVPAHARLEPAHLDALGVDGHGGEAIAVLLGSSTCGPCHTVRSLLTAVDASRDGFQWVYADAADHVDLVRSQRVARVPTLFVVRPDGRILARTSGVPARDELTRLLDRATAAA